MANNYEFKGFDCNNCGLITEDQACETKDPNIAIGWNCNECDGNAYPQFGPVPNPDPDEEEDDEPGFPYTTFCPDAVYADTHDPARCRYCAWLDREDCWI